MKKCAKIGKSKSLTALTRRLTDPQSIDRFIRAGNFKRLPHFFLCIVLLHSSGFFWFWLLETNFSAFRTY